MNARQAVDVERWALQDAAGNPTCALCGDRVIVLQDGEDLVASELCGTCNGVFHDLAARLAAAGRGPGGAAAVHVEGQLELEAGAVCEVHGWAHRFTSCEDAAGAPIAPAPAAEPAAAVNLAVGGVVHLPTNFGLEGSHHTVQVPACYSPVAQRRLVSRIREYGSHGNADRTADAVSCRRCRATELREAADVELDAVIDQLHADRANGYRR